MCVMKWALANTHPLLGITRLLQERFAVVDDPTMWV